MVVLLSWLCVYAELAGVAELADMDGPFLTLRLKGRFWHERSMVLARLANYLQKRIPVRTERPSLPAMPSLASCACPLSGLLYVLIREEGVCVVSVYDRLLFVVCLAVWFSSAVQD